MIDREKYIVPPHLHDLQEADLPETQRGLVISEIAQFRERAAKRDREKSRDVRDSMPSMGAPSGPKPREWGKPLDRRDSDPSVGKGFGKGAQGYSKPVGFVKADDVNAGKDPLREDKIVAKTDEELESERKEQRSQEEELSFKDVSGLLHLYHVLLLTDSSANAVMSQENGHEFKLLNERLFANAFRKKPRNEIG